MDHDDFVAALTPLVLAQRAEFDAPTWRAYYLTLKDVPTSVFAAAVNEEMRSPREFFPKAGELRASCERQRRILLAAHPWSACCECEDSPRWRSVLVDGTTRVEKCPCVARHLDYLGRLGLREAISPLPGEDGAGDVAVYPTLEQLPTPIQQRLRDVARQKVLK